MTLLAPFLLLLAVAAQDTETDRLKKEADRLKADNEVVLRQLEVALAQVKELTDRLAKTQDEKAREQANLATLEAMQVEAARAKKHAEEEARTLAARPRVLPIQAQVTAVADEIGLVVMSVGSDDGVRLGDEFTLTRKGDFVAKVVVDRADRKWCAAKVTLRKGNPAVGDLACTPKESPGDEHYRTAEELLRKGDRAGAMTESQRAIESDPAHLAARTLLKQLQATATLAATPTPVTPKVGEELKSLRKELDDVRNQVRQLSDRLVPSWQGVGIAVEEAPEPLRAHLGISRGLLIRRVREGSTAEKAGLKANDVLPDLQEAQALEAIEAGRTVDVLRQGQRLKLTGAKGR